MVAVWDYDLKKLKRTKQGRLLILERLINFGPTHKREKIDLSLVKKNWDKLHLFHLRKRLLELLIWGKIKTRTKYVSEEERLGMDRDEFFAYCLKRGFRRNLDRSRFLS